MARNNIMKRITAAFLLICIMFGLASSFLKTNEVSAHEAAVIRSFLDVDNAGYIISSEIEDSTLRSKKHNEMQTFALFSLIKADESNANVALRGFSDMTQYTSDVSKLKEGTIDPLSGDTTKLGDKSTAELFKTDKSGEGLALGFPHIDRTALSGWFGGGDLTTEEKNRASTIAGTLNPTLNNLIKLALKGAELNTAEQRGIATILASNLINPAFNGTTSGNKSTVELNISGGKTALIVYGIQPEDSADTINSKIDVLKADTKKQDVSTMIDKLPSSDKDGNLLVYILDKDTLYSGSELAGLGSIWAMPKGYKNVGQLYKPEFTYDKSSEDIQYITIHMLSLYANCEYIYSGISINNASNVQQIGWIEKAIYGLFETIINGVKELLGLYDMDELIFNQGSRGGVNFNEGLMPDTWWNIVLKYFTIIQVIAWMLIALAVAKNLVQLNFGTIMANSRERAELMDMIIKFFAVGAFLVLCIPIVRLMVISNNAIVQVFASAYSGDMSTMPRTSNIFAALAMSLFYMMISFYTNFVYIMRSITLAVLIALGPFFIVTMIFPQKGYGLFYNWLKEVAANIYLQAFHAFVFSFLFEAVVTQGGAIEKIAVIFSIIPLTEFFRSMIFGSAGGFAVSAGKQLGDMANRMTQKTMTSAVGGAMGVAGNQIAKRFDRGADSDSSAMGSAGGAAGKSGGGAAGQPAGGATLATGIKGAFQQKAAQSAQKAADNNGKGDHSGFYNGCASSVAALASMGGAVAQGIGGMNDMMTGMAMGDSGRMSRGATDAGQATGGLAGRGAATAISSVGGGVSGGVRKKFGKASTHGQTGQADMFDRAGNRSMFMGKEAGSVSQNPDGKHTTVNFGVNSRPYQNLKSLASDEERQKVLSSLSVDGVQASYKEGKGVSFTTKSENIRRLGNGGYNIKGISSSSFKAAPKEEAEPNK